MNVTSIDVQVEITDMLEAFFKTTSADTVKADAYEVAQKIVNKTERAMARRLQNSLQKEYGV